MRHLNVSPKDLRRHVRELCRFHGIKLRLIRYSGESADADGRTVYVREVRGEVSYLNALHEIAHVVSADCHHDVPIRFREPNAWTWAVRNSIIPISWQGYRAINRELMRYRESGWKQ